MIAQAAHDTRQETAEGLDDKGELYLSKENTMAYRNFTDDSFVIVRNYEGVPRFEICRKPFNAFDVRNEIPRGADLWIWQRLMERTDIPERREIWDEINEYAFSMADVVKFFSGDIDLLNDTLGLDIAANQ